MNRYIAWVLVLFCADVSSSPAVAEVSVPAMFGEGMVLQRRQPIVVFGRAEPNEMVAVKLFAGDDVKTRVLKHQGRSTTGKDGKWQVQLPSMEAGGSFVMEVRGKANQLVFRDVLIGEVWLCFGQSNMGLPVRSCNNAKEEIAAANYPRIRYFGVGAAWSGRAREDCSGKWVPCSPKTAGGFSGTAYFFGRQLHRDMRIPVGLVCAAWGGTRAEDWTPQHRFAMHPQLKKTQALLAPYLSFHGDAKTESLKLHQAWIRQNHLEDPGMTDQERKYAESQFDDSDWKEVNVPGRLPAEVENQRDIVVWFRKQIELPKKQRGKKILTVLSNPVLDDTCYINGKLVGKTDGFEHYYDKNNVVRPERIYGCLSNDEAANTIAIRVYDPSGQAGITGSRSRLAIYPGPTSLCGKWKYRVVHRVKSETGFTEAPIDYRAMNAPAFPGAKYNAMVHPWARVPIRGFVWYQGESSVYRDFIGVYDVLLRALIQGCRKDFGQPEMPFLIVQLPGWAPGGSNWATMREYQETALKLPKTGMAVTTDIGDSRNIHPPNKQDLGSRLARVAEAMVYEKSVPHTGPIYRKMKVGTKGRIALSFSDIAGKLVSPNQKLLGFEIAGAEGKFVPADARIAGANLVEASSNQIPRATQVRYNWAGDPKGRLTDESGLPARPFRTDRVPVR